MTGLRTDALELRVDHRSTEPPPAPRLVVVQALAKGDRGELAVELLTEVGVDEIVPWSAERSIVQWRGDRGNRSLERWRSTARESAKQARRVRFPVVTDLASTNQVAVRLRRAGRSYLLHEAAHRALSDADLPTAGDVVLVVGPEGGIAPAEIESLTDAGATPVRLGSTVLRTSTAGVVGAALVLSRTRWPEAPIDHHP